MGDLVIVFSCAALLSWLATPFIRRLCVLFGILDVPGPGKAHKAVIPRAGGVAIFIGFLSALMFPVLKGAVDLPFLLEILAAAFIIMLLGLLDDVRGTSFVVKFTVQAAVASWLVSNGAVIGLIPHPLAVPITVLWIVGVTNAINLQDGMDGLASGISFIAGLAFFVVGLTRGDPLLIFLSLALSGSCLGFLRHNFFPASVFMGDTGSLFLGFMLSVLGVVSTFGAVNFMTLIIPLLILGLPVLDTLFSILRRSFDRRHIFMPDRGHFYDLMFDRCDLSYQEVVLAVYMFSIFLGVGSLCII